MVTILPLHFLGPSSVLVAHKTRGHYVRRWMIRIAPECNMNAEIKISEYVVFLHDVAEVPPHPASDWLIPIFLSQPRPIAAL